jgi:hypothetical protein
MARGEQIKATRRRRNTDALGGKRRRLAVDESKLDRDNYEYRFINADPDRVRAFTVEDDWDIVQDRDGATKVDGDSAGSEVSVQAGGASGSQRQILVRKPKNLYNDDFAAQQRRIDATENALKHGSVPGGDAESTYVPNKGEAPMTVRRG